jgi:prepilin-type N-terminal cleavage/methylation domain-containing protein
MLMAQHSSRRRGFTLVEMVVAIGLVAIIAVVILVSNAVNTSGRSISGSDNVDKAAETLAELSEAIALYSNNGSGAQNSFFQVVGENPGALSHLTVPITTNDRNSCGRSTPLTNNSKYKNASATRWTGQFFRQALPTTGFLVAPGFFADDVLLRYSAVFNPAGPPYFQEEYFTGNDATTPGTLAIVMRNVAIQDATALANRVDGDPTGIFGAVRFTPNGTAPITVEYHIPIHGC